MKIPKAVRLPSGIWRIQLRLGGESIPVKALTEKACNAEARYIKAEYLAGRRVREPEPEPEPEPPTLGEILDEYIKSCGAADKSGQTSRSPATIRGYTIIRDNYFQPYMDRPVRPDREYWQDLYNSELRRLKAKTLKNGFSLLRTAYKFRFQVEAPLVSTVPVARSERPYLDEDQVKVFVAAAVGHPVEIPALLELHSLRVSEVLGLSWDHVDLRREQLTVRGAVVPNEYNVLVHKDTNKTAASQRTVPIFIPALLDALKSVPASKRRGPVSPYRSPSGIGKAVNAICRSAGLPEVGNHGLRHSFATICFSLGVSDLDCMRLGGWSDYQTMKNIYTHLSEKHQAETAAKLKSFYSPSAPEDPAEAAASDAAAPETVPKSAPESA